MQEYIFWPFVIPVVAIVGGVTYAIVKSLAIARVRELEVRERIAMIERGLVPPPETDPRGFERAMRRHDRTFDERDFYSYRRSPERYRSAGITLIGVGLGLMFLIYYAGEEPGSAIGVGGFLMILGAAFLVNSFFCRSRAARDPLAVPPSTPSTGPSSHQPPLQPGS
jgi:hypothetical protein